ncbi:hypothetical protein CAI21_10175 [Alkalilimnicola ehrlichii]|uniref:DUF306 domain-containing protein n=1 Tax=Alkalilimnicola ehrlichii TaxID=351052 RepID=A0A3E0WG53_9GAMM|nr:META domain-containing protein [Alkalilimnicola ehrlichii]RFA29417.1 hypothetical protein CAI21_10175 [Alkalilimnicola ehrlichii]RFA31934.1 hypothetical protein CAL65_21020 [Alkalilimnicola ehrlichii]
MKRLLVLSMAAGLGLLSACASVGEQASGLLDLDGTAWTVSRIEQKDSATERAATMMFEADRLGGHTGCNHYTAPVEIDGASLAIGMAAATKMACLGPIMEQEQQFFRALEAVDSYRVEGGELLLVDADGQERLRLIEK